MTGSSSVSVVVSGPKQADVEAATALVAAELKNMPVLINVKTDLADKTTQYDINVDPNKAILDGTVKAGHVIVIRSEGPRFLLARKPAKPGYWIAVDRDRDARGLFGIYQTVQAHFWKATSHRPALKWDSKPGATK